MLKLLLWLTVSLLSYRAFILQKQSLHIAKVSNI
jgi:hypothetical protein